MANAFAAQAAKIGMTVLIRDRLDPLNADYTAVLTRAKSLGTQALYYGGDPMAGAKVAKQSYDIIPGAVKGGGDGVHTPDMLTSSAMPAISGLVRHVSRDARAGSARRATLGRGIQGQNEPEPSGLFRYLL